MVEQLDKILLVSGNSDDYALASRLLLEMTEPLPLLEWIARPDPVAVLSALSGGQDICLIAHEPGLCDGFDLARDINARNARLPLVFLLKTPCEATRQAALQAGVTDCLSKSQLSAPLLERALYYANENVRLTTVLQESEERYQALVERASDIIYTMDLMGNFTSLNRAGKRVTGYDQEALQMNIAQILSPEHLAAARESIARKVGGVANTTRQVDIKAKDGRQIPVEVNTHLIYQNGKPVGVQGIARDISERRAAEQALRETNRWLNALVDHSPLAIYLLDTEGRVQMWNPAAEKLFGWTAAETLGHPLPTVLPDQEAEFNLLRQRALLSAGPFSGELNRQRKDGAILRVNVSAAPIHDENDNLHGLVCIVADLTAQTRAESEPRAAEE